MKGEKPKTEVIRDDEEIEKLKADLVQALENIRRYRELTETKEQEITALKSTHEHAISNLRADLKEKQEEVEDLRKAIRDLEAELVRVKENPIVKEVEVFKMADKPLESEPADD